MRHLIRFLGISLVASMLVGCSTQFVGEPKVPNGATGCRALCRAQGMELAGMVIMGEYSDGCICSLPGQNQAAVVAAASSQAVAGVMRQMQRTSAQNLYLVQ